ncbi:MAG: hypothetical protein HW403_1202, partial [Dehalococcoidia bacterium]|nr:hypothetical protein [Dehalococcoidia bacterium]
AAPTMAQLLLKRRNPPLQSLDDGLLLRNERKQLFMIGGRQVEGVLHNYRQERAYSYFVTVRLRKSEQLRVEPKVYTPGCLCYNAGDVK